MKPRVRAGLIHLALSAVLAAAVLSPIGFFWYPGALFERAGARGLFLLIVGVHVVLGPLLTSLVFVPGKKGLAFDLAVIALLQTAALAFGVYVLFESRPAYIVFVKDRYELIRANQFPEGELEKSRARGYDRLPLDGPKWVGARIPQDRDELQRLMTAGLAGLDLQHFPRYYVPYEDVRVQVRAAALPLGALRLRNPREAGLVTETLANLGRREEEVRFLPLRAGKADLAVLVDARTGDVLEITSLNPWE